MSTQLQTLDELRKQGQAAATAAPRQGEKRSAQPGQSPKPKHGKERVTVLTTRGGTRSVWRWSSANEPDYDRGSERGESCDRHRGEVPVPPMLMCSRCGVCALCAQAAGGARDSQGQPTT